MATIVHDFAWPDRVVIGTVGRPGERTFYLQVRAGREVVSVALEKQQAAVLAEKIDDILAELQASEGNRLSIPAVTPAELVDDEPLEQPLLEQFRAGAMTLGWDPTTAQVVVEAFPVDGLLDDDDDGDDDSADGLPREIEFEPSELLRVRLPVGTARAFSDRTRQVVEAGRPLCPLCGEPMDAAGHSCDASGLPGGGR
jgi:uncharacterized repeat protein (TIGR03847 family)